MKALTFKKVYTRDNGLIIQEAWGWVLTHGFAARLGIPLGSALANIYYVTDGVVEIWENQDHYVWLQDALLAHNTAHPDFLKGVYEEHRESLKEFEILKARGPAQTVPELQELIDLLYKGSLEFILLYYSAVDTRTPEAIKKYADIFRENDHFYDDFDVILRQSLRAIYQEVAGYEFVILKGEIDGSFPAQDELARRMEHFVFLSGVGGEVMTIKTYALNHPEYQFEFEGFDPKVVEREGLTGSIGYAGTVTGRVRVLKHKHQVHELQPGEVLVASMTTPGFVPAMKVASAFVTDEGGVTCHAAIIARELKKPCVIGTKFATKVFKDGDLVEVDAEKGVVKKV